MQSEQRQTCTGPLTLHIGLIGNPGIILDKRNGAVVFVAVLAAVLVVAVMLASILIAVLAAILVGLVVALMLVMLIAVWDAVVISNRIAVLVAVSRSNEKAGKRPPGESNDNLQPEFKNAI
jgi:hypothetical protein